MVNESTNKMSIKTINIVVGGRFHSEQIYHALVDSGYDVKVYASSPKQFFKNIPHDRIVFVPKFIQILQKLSKRRMPRILHTLNSIAFDWLISRIMRPADLLWGFNGDSLYCGIKIQQNGGIYVVDRACPHFVVQEELLIHESEKIGFAYSRFPELGRRRFVQEYDVADAIVVPSIYSQRSFSEKGIPASKVHIISLDANAPKSSSEDKLSMLSNVMSEKSEFRVGMVGGAFLRKGIIYLLRSMLILNKSDAVLYIRAEENNLTRHPEARDLCKELGVVFVPYLDDINEFYRNLDVFVLPSIDEGFGMVVYESLRNGIPVLASTNVGAIDGMVPDVDFINFTAGDEYALAQGLERLYEDRQYLKSIGESGRRFYVRKINNEYNYKWNLKHLISQFDC